MPFTNFANSHKCAMPTQRPSGDALEFGDEWRCDQKLKPEEGDRICNRSYRWINTQREGNLWMPINDR